MDNDNINAELSNAENTESKTSKPIKTIPPPRKELLGYLPEFLRVILEIQYILKSEQEQLDELDTLICDLMHDQFIEIATETGIRRWEKILEWILPYDGNDDWEYRRKRIQEKIAERLPYTERTLCDRLDIIIGKDNYEFSVKGYNARADVHFPDGLTEETLAQYALVIKTLYRFLPANLTLFSAVTTELPMTNVTVIPSNVAIYRKTTINNDMFFCSGINADVKITLGVSSYKRITVKSQIK